MKAPSANLLSIGSLFVFFAAPAPAADWPQWRGPQRTGVSVETGLFQQWPTNGPKLLWQVRDIGAGYSTPAVAGNAIYLLSNEGLENEFVQALSVQDGRRLWQTRLGNVGNPKQQPNFPAARSTPTVDGECLYALSSDGDLACLECGAGKVRWKKSLRADFGGKPGDWAYAESPLVDGDKLVTTPGGAEATVVALNKKTGEVLWKTALPDADDAAYSSALVVEAAGVKQYVQMLQKGLVGLDARSGKLLWRYTRTVSSRRANIPSPLARGDTIFSAGAGTGAGLVRLKPTAGGVEAEQVYFFPKLPTAIGGVILSGDCLYGATDQTLVCADFASGAIKWSERALGPASLCCADGRLYLHGENGDVALVEPSAEAYHEKGRFTPPDRPKRSNAMEKAWAYPVVSGGCLYVREQQMLWCYDIKAL